MKVEDVQALGARIDGEIAKAVVGQAGTVRFLTIALLSAGHVLLEGPPGTAKTLLAQSFARTLHLDFGRIQFTPDLMPGDLIGSNLFNFQTSQFELTRGPVFCEILLADEINRTPPKTQAALLEAMQERSITLDGRTERLSDRFTVIATQNPIEQQGVYPLPEAQLDRFLLKVRVGYPTAEDELNIAVRSAEPRPDLDVVMDADTIAKAVAVCRSIRVSDSLMRYVVALVRATRDPGTVAPELAKAVAVGASPRASIALAAAARATAFLDGRGYALPEDVKAVAPDVFRHRILPSYEAEADGMDAERIAARLLDLVDMP